MKPYLDLHLALTRLLGEPLTLEEVSTQLLEILCTSLGFDWSAVWRIDPDENALRFVKHYCIASLDASRLEDQSRLTPLRKGFGLPGAAWDADRPIWISDVLKDPRVVRAEGARTAGLHAGFGFPIRSGHEVVGVVELMCRAQLVADNALMAEMNLAGNLIGHFITVKQAEEALRESESRKAAIIETALDCILCMDERGRIVEFNPAAERTFGHAREDVLGRELAEVIVPPALRDRHRQGLRHWRETGEGPVLNRRIEIVAMRADGEEFPVELSITVSRPESRAVFTGYVRDISDRLRAEAELAARARQAALGAAVGAALTNSESLPSKLRRCTEALVEHLDAAFARIWTLDDIGKTLELQASSGLYTHLDGPHGRVPVGQFKIGRIAEQCRPHLTNQVMEDPQVSDREWAKREGMSAFAGYPLLAQGRLVGVMAAFARQELPDSALHAMASVADEVSLAIVQSRATEALKRQAQALARSNADLEQFAYVASHDLQEPLRMISSYTQLLARKYRGRLDEKADKYIDYAVDGANRMQRLINDLLQYSRVGRQEEAKGPVALDAVVSAACRNLQSAIAAARVAIEFGGLPKVVGNEALLVQLFQNLIGNAIKFRSERPVVVGISAEVEEGRTVIKVSDNGIGIEPQYRERIFAIFQRLHGKAEYPGTGIGLALCKKIVEWHGGTIRDESTPGEGSTFIFTL